MFNFSDIAKITDGKILKQNTNPATKYLVTDSRKAIISEQTLFIAIKGKKHDGHQFIPSLYKQGIRQFIIENQEIPDEKKFPEANFISVKNSIAALQAIATAHRNNFKIPIIGITGSNGKTIVKEWLSQLFSGKYRVVRSPKSYNSQIGVPLSVWQMTQGDEMGVFEAGISRKGEMENLVPIIRPSIGIITNIGPAHDEGFTTREEKIQEKCKLFSQCNIVIYCADHKQVAGYFEQNHKKFKAEYFVWSYEGNTLPGFATYKLWVTHNLASGNYTALTLQFQKNNEKKDLSFLLPFKDHASIENCMHCIACLLYDRFTPEQIQKGLNGLRPVTMRLELKAGVNNCMIVDDSYNNDLSGIQIAIDFLNQQNHRKKKTVILSDIYQTGLPPENLIPRLQEILTNEKIDRFIGIGPVFNHNQHLFSDKTPFWFYEDTPSFLDQFSANDFKNELILIKGARNFGFEEIVKRIQEKIHGTSLEINLDALTHNLNFYKSQLRQNTKILAMVKAFSYGSASFEIANLLQFHRIDYLGVAYADEGISLRNHGITLPIIILNPSPESFNNITEYDLEPEIYSFYILDQFINYFQTSNHSEKKLKIHIKIDSGMHRLGFQEDDITKLNQLLRNHLFLEVASVFTHLAAADEEVHDNFSHGQVALFNRCYEQIAGTLGYFPIKHILNSAGILRFPEYQYDMVRLGIGLYGVEVTGKAQNQLEPVSTLKTIISQIKNIKQGETIGYSRKGKASKPMKIATIAIGYADGFDRRFGNGMIHVLVNGYKAPTIGNVCMDMTMIDITGIEAREGDEVIIFGREQPVKPLADAIGTIPYEILTNISERVKRIFYTE